MPCEKAPHLVTDLGEGNWLRFQQLPTYRGLGAGGSSPLQYVDTLKINGDTAQVRQGISHADRHGGTITQGIVETVSYVKNGKSLRRPNAAATVRKMSAQDFIVPSYQSPAKELLQCWFQSQRVVRALTNQKNKTKQNRSQHVYNFMRVLLSTTQTISLTKK